MKNRLVMTLVAVLAVPSANAGIFGPDNYDECMLDYLKGEENKTLIRLRDYASSACETKFPYEKDITSMKDDVTTSWWKDSDKVFLKITDNFSGYHVDRVKARLLPVCNPSDVKDNIRNHNDGLTVNFTFRSKVSQSSVSLGDVSPDDFNCMRTEEIYGTKKK